LLFGAIAAAVMVVLAEHGVGQVAVTTRIDIGQPTDMEPRHFYTLERQQVDGYWNYLEDLQP
jgi:hypothetical protein